jgi:hypothetical protein
MVFSVECNECNVLAWVNHAPGNPFFFFFGSFPCQDDLQEPRHTILGNIQVDLVVYCFESGNLRSHHDRILASLVPSGTKPFKRSTSIVSKASSHGNKKRGKIKMP